ncbi:MAG: Rpn family recombination-promoting nuclease/putative transposase [Bacteroidales bacterium]|nr:Rpn family recombination-promoting nuclease/putative transposase [Bacteroidales bacterium]
MGTDTTFARYINFYTDFAFKRFFGTEANKDLLISFLNALLFRDNSNQDEFIQDVSYLPTEHLGEQEIDRRAVFDVYCTNNKGERFIIEMQKASQIHFRERSLFYATFPIREQAVKGKEWDYDLKGIYIIGVLNFTFEENNQFKSKTPNTDVISEIVLMNKKNKEVFYDKLTFIYLEMPKFLKKENELVTILDKWLYVLKNLYKLLEKPKELQERVFERVFEIAEITKYNPQELAEYEDSLMVYRDYMSTIHAAEYRGRIEGIIEGRREGRREGRKEGIELGRVEEKIQMVKNMKQKGLSFDIISSITGLTIDEINNI